MGFGDGGVSATLGGGFLVTLALHAFWRETTRSRGRPWETGKVVAGGVQGRRVIAGALVEENLQEQRFLGNAAEVGGCGQLGECVAMRPSLPWPWRLRGGAWRLSGAAPRESLRASRVSLPGQGRELADEIVGLGEVLAGDESRSDRGAPRR